MQIAHKASHTRGKEEVLQAMGRATPATTDHSDSPESTRKQPNSTPRSSSVGSGARKAKNDPLIFWVALAFMLVFIALTLTLGQRFANFLSAGADWALTYLNWLYIGGVSLALIFLIVLFVSRFGRMRLGADGEQPEHSTLSWFAMLFAGGMGSSLMFYGVAEPLNHAVNPPLKDQEPMSLGAIKEAIGFSMYHFGVHMWLIFAVPGLALGYFIYKRHLPPRVSSIFAPVMGRWVYRWPGKIIDALSIIGTVFGLAVSVGLGTLQINSGLARLFGAPTVAWVQVAIIAVVVLASSMSVAAGLEKGIKMLSNMNILLAVVLMLFILATGPTLLMLRGTMDTASLYAEYLPKIMFWSDSWSENPGWQGKWTVFYWAWTICWSPFVGMFLARISRGRTVREFIGGVLLLPAAFSVLWFAVFGMSALDIERKQPGVLSNPAVRNDDTAAALFEFLSHFPWAGAVSVLALVVIAFFFVTSIDSAAMITDMFAAGEEDATPTYFRVLWAVLIGGVAAGILVMSPDAGIDALQEVVIIIGLPFFFIKFVMMYSIVKGMNADYHALPDVETRQWGRTDSAEKLELHESRPAPGYDDEGKQLPRLEYDEEGNIVIPGNVHIQGNLGVIGDVDHDPDPVPESPQYNKSGDLVDDEGWLIDDEGNRLAHQPEGAGPHGSETIPSD